jgi:hypothetical protein
MPGSGDATAAARLEHKTSADSTGSRREPDGSTSYQAITQ